MAEFTYQDMLPVGADTTRTVCSPSTTSALARGIHATYAKSNLHASPGGRITRCSLVRRLLAGERDVAEMQRVDCAVGAEREREFVAAVLHDEAGLRHEDHLRVHA